MFRISWCWEARTEWRDWVGIIICYSLHGNKTVAKDIEEPIMLTARALTFNQYTEFWFPDLVLSSFIANIFIVFGTSKVMPLMNQWGPHNLSLSRFPKHEAAENEHSTVPTGQNFSPLQSYPPTVCYRYHLYTSDSGEREGEAFCL